MPTPVKQRLFKRYKFFRRAIDVICVPPGLTKCALDLARAERLAAEVGIGYVEMPDLEPMEFQNARGEWQQKRALVISAHLPDGDDAGPALATLAGIDADLDDEAMRVVHAQLALTALEALAVQAAEAIIRG